MKKTNKLTTHIIAGKYKNKQIILPKLETTRSSKAILRESFFNVVQFDIIDKVFIEGFGGSGAIGLEALSRGAKHSYFCEINKNSYKTLVQNCKNIALDDTTILLANSFVAVPNLLEQLKNSKDEIILYLDPPFDFRDGMDDIYKQSFQMVENITNDNIALITFEHKTGLDMPKNLGQFQQYKTKKFGKSSLTYYRV
jgi:16S rRNA (guanine(966)-N(2))-methyltransferase RsmD